MRNKRVIGDRAIYSGTGFCRFAEKRKKRTGKVKYSPIFFAAAEDLKLFKVNKETSKIQLWNLSKNIGSVDETHFRLLIRLEKMLRDGNWS
ncbi:hypothetical protein LIT25_06055 [Bacillus sp. F19]|nr:hypothetical protein LIT25_06055 [Bacillus sp. F19]